MFGENQIIGEKNIKVSRNNKITLPKFTGAEEGDCLVFIRSLDDFMIFRTEHFLTLVDYYQKKLKTITDLDDRKKIKNNIKKLYYSILREVECDKNRQIILPSQIKCNEMQCIGQRKHLILKPIRKDKED